MTVAEARAVVRQSPGKYRAAVVWAPGTPLLDHPEARASLHETVKGARFKLDADKVSRVSFAFEYTEGCETCDYGSTRANLSYSYDGRYETAEIDISAGQFIQECVARL